MTAQRCWPLNLQAAFQLVMPSDPPTASEPSLTSEPSLPTNAATQQNLATCDLCFDFVDSVEQIPLESNFSICDQTRSFSVSDP